MVRLVQKCCYIKNGKAAGYMKYIATREGVERLHGQGPATASQKRLIRDILRDFPDSRELFEYADFQAAPSLENASAFISMALDANVQNIDEGDIYMRYIATRPRVQKRGDHGLFGQEERVDLAQTMATLDAHTGNVWTVVYSLRREDAARLGFDRAEAWRTLLLAKQAELATNMNIPLNDLVWYAAYHDEGSHPHIHLMLWSQDPKQGYLTPKSVLGLRSAMTNAIFKDELLHVYEQKDISYKELCQAARSAMAEMIASMESGVCDDPQIETLLGELAEGLKTYQGKKQYGYLPKPLKALTNRIVDRLAALPDVAACYEEWNKLRDAVESYYKDTPRQRLPLSEQKEFHAVRNIVVKEAVRLAGMEFAAMDQGQAEAETAAGDPTQAESTAPVFAPMTRSAALSAAATHILRDVARVFRHNSVPPANPAGPRIDSKRRRQIMEKRLAMGQRLDDTMQSLT